MRHHTRTISRHGEIRFRGDTYLLPLDHAYMRRRRCRILPLKEDGGDSVLVKTLMLNTPVCFALRREAINPQRRHLFGASH